jgi:hypothetical protein
MKKMRYLGVLMLVTLFLTQGIKAQDIEITPMLGYAVRNDLRFIEGRMEVTDLMNIGANFSFPTANYNSKFEITLSNSFTRAHWDESPDYADLIKELDYTMMVTYFHIAWVLQGELSRDLTIFCGPNVGLVNYNISKSEVENMPRFSIGAQTGLNYYFDRALGVKVQALAALPVFMGSGKHFRGITEYPGQESYLTVNSTTFPLNLVISAGLVFRINTRY